MTKVTSIEVPKFKLKETLMSIYNCWNCFWLKNQIVCADFGGKKRSLPGNFRTWSIGVLPHSLKHFPRNILKLLK